LIENFEGKIQKGNGTWEIAGDTLVLSAISPKNGPLSVGKRYKIWTDTLNKVQVANFNRLNQRAKKSE
jgi:hypothetical protein